MRAEGPPAPRRWLWLVVYLATAVIAVGGTIWWVWGPGSTDGIATVVWDDGPRRPIPDKLSVVHSQVAFAPLWDRLDGRQAPPEADFTRSSLIVASFSIVACGERFSDVVAEETARVLRLRVVIRQGISVPCAPESTHAFVLAVDRAVIAEVDAVELYVYGDLERRLELGC